MKWTLLKWREWIGWEEGNEWETDKQTDRMIAASTNDNETHTKLLVDESVNKMIKYDSQ